MIQQIIMVVQFILKTVIYFKNCYANKNGGCLYTLYGDLLRHQKKKRCYYHPSFPLIFFFSVFDKIITYKPNKSTVEKCHLLYNFQTVLQFDGCFWRRLMCRDVDSTRMCRDVLA